jgi:hypothetical protein
MSKDFKAEFCQELGELLAFADDCERYNPLYHSLPDQTCSPKGDSKCSTCMICQGKFVSYKGMVLHRSKTHDKQAKTSPCSLCSKRFTSKYARKSHVKQVHLKATRVNCDLCDRVLYDKYAHQRHLKRDHPSQNSLPLPLGQAGEGKSMHP